MRNEYDKMYFSRLDLCRGVKGVLSCQSARVVGGATGKVIAFLRLNSGGAGGWMCWVNNAGIIDWNYSQLIGILDPV